MAELIAAAGQQPHHLTPVLTVPDQADLLEHTRKPLCFRGSPGNACQSPYLPQDLASCKG